MGHRVSRVAAMDSCFSLVWTHQLCIARCEVNTKVPLNTQALREQGITKMSAAVQT